MLKISSPVALPLDTKARDQSFIERCLRCIVIVIFALHGPAALAHFDDTIITAIKDAKPSMVTKKANKKKGFFKTAEQKQREAALGKYNEFFEDEFKDLPTFRNGSGFVIASNEESSWILTAAYVVVGASKISVKTAEGRSVKATLLNSDPASDVALIRVELGQLPALVLSQSSPKEGQSVIGLGAAFSLSMSSSLGIVSALNVNLNGASKTPLIQTDVSINPGSSGGALINTDSEVVGVITKIYSSTGLFSGASFAVSSTHIQSLITRWLTLTGSSSDTKIGASK